MHLRALAKKIPGVLPAYRWWFRQRQTRRMSVAPNELNVGNATIRLLDDVGMKRAYLQPDYFAFYDAMIERYVAPGDVVFDVGAHVGVTASVLSARVGSTGTVVAFEPVPDVLAVLRANLASNNLTNVVVEATALANSSGETSLFVNTVHSGYTAIDRLSAEDWLQNPADVYEIRVPIQRVDDYLAAHPERAPSFIKIDCQGAEYEILCGARGLLQRATARPLFVYLEFWPMAIESTSGLDGVRFLETLLSWGLRIVYAENHSDLAMAANDSSEARRAFVERVARDDGRTYTNLVIERPAAPLP